MADLKLKPVCCVSVLATDFSLKAPDFPEVDYPVKVLNTPQGCMWYKKDNKFRKPKGN